MATTGTTTGTSNEAAVAGAIERWNAGDLDGYLEVYADDTRLHGYTPEPMDKTAVRGFYEGIHAAFESPTLEFHEELGSGDTVTIRFTLGGRHVGEFMGVPATGTAIALPGITIIHFRGNERAVERHSVADMLGLLVQLGAVPAPA